MAPIQPSSQRQLPATQMPWPPQSDAQSSVGVNRGGSEKGKGTGKTQARGGVIGDKSRSYCQRSGGHAPLACLMGLEKEFSHLIREERIPLDNTNLISLSQKEGGKRELCPIFPMPLEILTFYVNGNTSAFIKSYFAMI